MGDQGTGVAVERANARLHRLRRAWPGLELELYQRESESLRLTIGADGTETIRQGSDRGTSLRGFDPRLGRALFCGSTRGDLRDLVEPRATASRSAAAVDDAPRWWAGGVPLRDLDSPAPTPTADALRGWLGRAMRHRVDIASAWVEAAITREVWVGDHGLDAVRTRARGWAFLRPRHPQRTGGATPRPLFVAHRRWDSLPEVGFGIPDRRPVGSREPAPPGRHAVLMAPAAVSVLIGALARVWSPPLFGVGDPVGAGWVLVDDPTEPQALFGGLFDDAGFPAEAVSLADGRRVVGHLPAVGRLRRPSYRDRPTRLPGHPIVDPPPITPPEGRLEIDQIGLQPLGPRSWLLLGAGIRHGAGGIAAIDPVYLRVDPVDLVQRCAGGVGDPVASHRGGRSPALLFDGLEVVGGPLRFSPGADRLA